MQHATVLRRGRVRCALSELASLHDTPRPSRLARKGEPHPPRTIANALFPMRERGTRTAIDSTQALDSTLKWLILPLRARDRFGFSCYFPVPPRRRVSGAVSLVTWKHPPSR
jgi:hypothetical protein